MTMKKVNRWFCSGNIGKITVLITLIVGYSQSFASCNISGIKRTRITDTSVSAYMKQYLGANDHTLLLYYPKSVRRFYQTQGEDPAWVNTVNARQTWQAMMLLDCVLQYGLSFNDYHPKELLYDPLHTMIEEPGKISNIKKAKFDILLTDALIALMNNMHYGKLNPEYAADNLDEGLMVPFHAETALLSARQQPDFTHAVENAQPQSKQYAAMQDKMRQLEGVYKGDCYEPRDEEIVKIAINMERLRWANPDVSTYIQVNIPSYTLKYVQPDTTYLFKVVVGKTSAPTPTLNSEITYFTTFPEWKIPQKIFINELLPKALKDTGFFDNNHYSIYDKTGKYVSLDRATLLTIKRHPDQYYARQSSGCDNALGQLVFRFRNVYDIYLHDTPEQKLFSAEERPFSHSCIRVEKAVELASLMLKTEGGQSEAALLEKAMKRRLTRNISLKTPIPIKITYLTCEVNQGEIITYKDVYGLDKSLAMALYSTTESLTVK